MRLAFAAAAAKLIMLYCRLGAAQTPVLPAAGTEGTLLGQNFYLLKSGKLLYYMGKQHTQPAIAVVVAIAIVCYIICIAILIDTATKRITTVNIQISLSFNRSELVTCIIIAPLAINVINP